mgnify:FL=1
MLFRSGVYKPELAAEALSCLGYKELADNLDGVSDFVRNARWKLKAATGYDPMNTRIPKRFSEIVTWKGPVDPAHMEALRQAYAKAVTAMINAPG